MQRQTTGKLGKTMDTVAVIESTIGITFQNPALLWQALTHPTYARSLGTPDAHNEWLALLGDALLGVIVLESLYGVHGNQAEKGFLSGERDRWVKDAHLETLAATIRLSELMRIHNENAPIRQKDITNAFEALLAAVYLDQGLAVAQTWYTRHFLDIPQPPHQPAIAQHSPTSGLETVEAAIGHTFSNKALLQTAITDRSHAIAAPQPKHHNEGLALLGDALLNFIGIEYLYQHRGNRARGTLSVSRTQLVSDSVLKVIADGLGLQHFIRHRGRVGAKNLTDGVEAILASIYLDQGLDIARDWFFQHLPADVLSQVEQPFCQEASPTQVEALGTPVEADYRKLEDFLSQGQWRDADLETREVMLQVIGRVDYLPGPAIDTFDCEALQTINQLWVHYSGGRFGFSIQVKILQAVGGDWDQFGDRIGWRVNGVWQPGDDRQYHLQAPAGHLPSAALRAAGKGPKARKRILNRFEACALTGN